ncbi:CapA family protein [Rubeoparvulum massiliense]|uniref:CapA family protein n=1 Tax=Rubeoparvulum massiliense TaxID=1631346 RepID=UPI00065E9A66|nr:CapA family protein [Rubeoparvulum massiliense]
MSEISFFASGDSFIVRRYPGKDEAFKKLAELINQADVRFANLETTVHNKEATPSAQSGGTWAMAQSKVLDDIRDYGFNLLNLANNHTLDYLYDGIERTLHYLNQYDFVYAGVGMNLAEADEPKYLETLNGRVALIGVCSSFFPFNPAGEQRRDMKGRPGLNPLRFDRIHVVKPERIPALMEVAEKVELNTAHRLSIKEGFASPLPEGQHLFAPGILFKEGEEEGLITKPNEKDMKRIIRRIHEAKRQSDYVLVSLHAHEMKGDRKDVAADFVVEFAHRCIDEGAHAFIGHGPHILRGMEIYKNRPIFYSLGDFIFQNDSPTHFPHDFYLNYGLGHEDTIADAFDTRSDHGKKGLGTNRLCFESLVPFWTMEDGELKEITLYPIELGFGLPRYRMGWPQITKNEEILKHFQELSEPYGTKIEIKDGVGKIVLK